MNWETWETSLLALMIWREARNQGEIGMRATGHVAWNRHRESSWSLGEIIVQDGQFTSINPPKKSYDPQLDVWPVPSDATFQQAMMIASEIVNGTSVDPTGGATFYWNPKTANSPWFERIIAYGPGYEKSAVIGAHEFFRPRRDEVDAPLPRV